MENRPDPCIKIIGQAENLSYPCFLGAGQAKFGRALSPAFSQPQYRRYIQKRKKENMISSYTRFIQAFP